MRNTELCNSDLKNSYRHKSNKKSKNLTEILFIAVISFLLLLIFSLATSPIYNIYGADSLEYKLAGSAILDGLVMFKDIFHQKGALFLFVEAIGEAICRVFNDNRIGTFIIQFFNFFFSMLIAEKCAYRYLESKQNVKRLSLAVIGIVMSVALFWCGTLLFGNQVEEFAVLYQMAAVVITVKYCMKQSESAQSYNFSPACGVILGICFAVTFWFKPTTAVIVGGCVLYIGLMLLIKKRFSCAFKNIAAGILGIAVITVPLLLYYHSQGALNDMLEQCFMFNIKYIDSQKAVTNWPLQLVAVYGIIIGFPVVSAVFSIITKFKPICVFAFVVSAVNLIMLLLTSVCYIFYIEVEVPIFFVILLCLYELKSKKINLQAFGMVLLLIASLGFSGFQQMHRYSYLDKQQEYWQEVIRSTDNFIENTNEIIDKSENKNMLYVTPDYSTNRYMCYETKLYPFSNLFSLEFFDRIGISDYVTEFYDELENNSPKYIVIDNDRENIYDVYNDVIQKAETEYTAVYSDEEYTLYELK